MGAAWLWARADLRRRWQGLAVIVLVLGGFGAFALTALVGARRADSAWDRFRAETRAPDAFVSVPSRNDRAATEEIRRLPGVADAGGFYYVPVAPQDMPAGGAFAFADERLGHTLYRPRILDGRRPDPSKADEVTVNPAFAEAAGVGPGDRVTLIAQDGGGFSLGALVVGVHLGTTDVGVNATFPSALLTPAFLARHGHEVEIGRLGQFVRLTRGEAGLDEFQAAVSDHFGPGGGVIVAGAQEDDAGIRDALRVQASALALVAAAAAAATLVAVGQALTRHLAGGINDVPALAALGMTFPQRITCALPAVTIVGAAGAAVAALVAYVATPLVPTGLARQVVSETGRTFDPIALLGGPAVLAVLVAAVGGRAAWRSSRSSAARAGSSPRRPRSLPVWFGPTATVGVNNALGSGTARTRTIARSALIAALVGTLSVTGAATFAVSLDHLVDTPRLYGWDFDVLVGVDGTDQDQIAAAANGLVDDRDVPRVAVVELGFLTLGGETVETLVVEPRKGRPIHPTLVAGRPPVAPGEISLGSGTVERLGVDLGDKVEAVGVSGSVDLTVVGQSVFPVLGENTTTDGAWITVASRPNLRLEVSRGSFVMADVVDGADPVGVVRRHTDLFAGLPIPPSDVMNLRQVGSSPWALAVFLAILGLAAVGHALVVSVRAGRRDFAVLRALGFSRRQVRSAVRWQASAVMLVALAGLPVGVAAGRWVWTVAASGRGVLMDTVLPLTLLAAIVAAGFAASHVVAVIPAQLAARMPPSRTLRAE
ncbi:MAG: FtsX-like permease family protein [Actinomycetota bacterium]|nr:FtsX-like permease family protein [Actinomycetota bacterium]